MDLESLRDLKLIGAVKVSDLDSSESFGLGPGFYRLKRIRQESKTSYKVQWAGKDPATRLPYQDTWVSCKFDLLESLLPQNLRVLIALDR